jgi:hypothetical protein
VATRLLNLTAYPSVLLLGWAVAEGLSGRRLGGEEEGNPHSPAGRPDRAMALGCAALAILMILPQTLIRFQGDYAPASLLRERLQSPLSYRGALEELEKRARPGDTVLSDFVTSYAMPTFAPVSIVAHFRDDFGFQTSDHESRLEAIDQTLSPLSSADSTLKALDRYGAEWIVVNRRVTNPLTVEKLDRISRLCPRIRHEYERDGLSVWSVHPAAGDSGGLAIELPLIPATIFTTLREPGTGLQFDPASGIGAVMGPDSAAAGDTLYLTLYYESRPAPAPANLYPKLIREAAYGSRFRWFTRQIRNSLFGRGDSILLPRDLAFRDVRSRNLPRGAVFPDMFELPVLPGLVPGRYGLYVREGGFPTEGNLGLRLGEVEIVSASD